MAEEQIYQEDQAAPPPPGDETPLPEEHRKKLDTIVGQMILNKESEDNIKAVVSDFKTKYKSPIASDVDQSKNLLQSAYDKNVDKTLYNMLEDQHIKSERDKIHKAQELGEPIPSMQFRFPDEVKQQVAEQKDVINQNPDLARPVIKRIIKDNPNEGAALKKAMYVIDASKREHSPAVVKHNADRIASGDLDYDIDNRQIVKPTGFVDQVFRNIKQHSDAIDNYNFITTHDKKDVINKYESELNKYDPDTPVYKSKNAGGDIGGMIGGNLVPMAKMELPKLLAPVPVLGEVAAGAGIAWGAQDFHHTAFANTHQQVYSELRRNGADPDTALAKADEEAPFSGNLAAAQGLALGVIGAKAGKSAEFKPVTYKAGFTKALTDIGKNSSELVKSLAPDVSSQSAIAGGIKAIENAHQGKETGEGVGDAMLGSALFIAGLGALRGHEVFLTKKAYNNLVQGYSDAPPEVVDRGLNTLVQHGDISKDQAVSIKNELGNHKVLNENKVDVHSPITPEAEQVLKSVAEDGVPAVMTKALEKIAKENGIEPEKTLEGKEKPLKPDDVIEALQRRADKVKPPPTFEDRTKIDPEKLKGTYKVMYEKDPEGFEKFIAEQVHSGNRTELEQADGITKPIIDAAIKKYPEHQVSEPKESSVSVIRPEENTAPNIVNLKTEANALQEQSPSSVLQHPPEAAGETGGERSGVERGQQGNETPGTSPQEAVKNTGEVPPVEASQNDLPFGNQEDVGIAHKLQELRAHDLKVLQPERGEGITIEESLQKGKDLIQEGTKPEDVVAEFKKNGKVSGDDMSVVRARYNELAKATNNAYEKFGDNSDQYKAALKNERDWYNDAVKPMQTEWHKIGVAQQSATDIDTGTVSGLARAFHEKSGKEFTPEQKDKAKELSEKVSSLTKEVEGLKQKLTDAIDKGMGEGKTKATYAEKTKAYADAFRKLKTKPFTFKDQNGNDIEVQKMGVGWNDIVEAGAKIIEKTGEIADGIAEVIGKIKDADWYKGLSDADKDRFAKELEAHYNENAPEIALAEKFVDKKGNKFEPEEVKDIWDYAKKEYLDKNADFDDMVNGVAMDLGLSIDQVRSAIAQPKGAKPITDEMYKKQYQRRVAEDNARAWVNAQGQPKVAKFLKAIPDAFFGLKVFGHGTVGMITHAGTNIFRPSAWRTYWPNFFKQFNFAFGSTAKYEQAIQDLVHDPEYIKWKRAGLAVDPTKVYDDYSALKKYFGRIGLAGDRGFNALKVYRLAQAKEIYSHLSNVEKADPETAQEIAKIVNHATGTSKIPLPAAANVAFFAPRLEASRWSRLIAQPAKALTTFTNWEKSSIAEKAAAKIVAKRAGEILATYVSMLAANQALLMMAGSDQKINVTNPLASDWLKFKAGEHTLDATGGMVSTLRFLSGLVHASIESQKDLKGKERFDVIKSSIGDYAAGKLSPFASTVKDFATHKDFMGNVLPPYSDEPKKGKHTLSWKEYLLTQQTPIPVSEAIKDVTHQMKEKGMTEPQIDQIMEGIVVGAISGGTGAKVGDIPAPKSDTKKKSKAKINHNFTN